MFTFVDQTGNFADAVAIEVVKKKNDSLFRAQGSQEWRCRRHSSASPLRSVGDTRLTVMPMVGITVSGYLW